MKDTEQEWIGGERKIGEWGDLGEVERVQTGQNTFYERRIYFHTNKQTKKIKISIKQAIQ